MPGFNLKSAGFDQDSLPYHHDGLDHKHWYANDYFEFSGNYHNDYPHGFHEQIGVYFEGMVYNLDPEKEFSKIAKLLDDYRFDEVIEAMQHWDGEYVFMHRDQGSKSIYIVNDAWGRLPVYYWQSKNKFIVTRNISCITHYANPVYNKLNLGLNLLLGTDLGTNTIWKKVLRLPPKSILHIHADGHCSLYEYFHLKNVNGKEKMADVAEQIQNQFDTALKNRLDKLPKSAISLSGGLDSRLIAAAAKKIGAEDCTFITYRRNNGADVLDDQSAEKIVQKLELKNHEYFEIKDPVLEDANELLQFKQGVNFLSMSYILPYYRMHQKRGLTTITGDGGGKFFVDLSALKPINSMRSLMRYLLRYNAFCSIETAANIAGVSPIELEENLIGHLELYPYASYADKYIYFTIREAGINWAFEGEDRNRQYCWSTSPFYNPELIDTCLSIPQSSKAYGALYNYLYQQYPGDLHFVVNPNWKEAVVNQKEVKRIHDKQRLKAFLPHKVLEFRKNVSKDHFIFQEELDALMNVKKHKHLHLKGVKSRHSMNFYWQLYTLLKLMEANK